MHGKKKENQTQNQSGLTGKIQVYSYIGKANSEYSGSKPFCNKLLSCTRYAELLDLY